MKKIRFVILGVIALTIISCSTSTTSTNTTGSFSSQPATVATEITEAPQPDITAELVYQIVPESTGLSWQPVEVTSANPIVLGNIKAYLDGESICVRHESVNRVFRVWTDSNLADKEYYYTDGLNAQDTHYIADTGNTVQFGVEGDTIVFVKRTGNGWQIAQAITQ